MKKSVLLIIGLLPQFAFAGILKFDEDDARERIEKSDAIFEAKAVKVDRILLLRDGTEVTEEELEKLENPEDGSLTSISAIVSHEAVFEIVKVYKGTVAPGEKFTLKWKDLHRAMCGHMETRMLSKPELWTKQEADKKKYRPYPGSYGKLILKLLGETKGQPEAAPANSSS